MKSITKNKLVRKKNQVRFKSMSLLTLTISIVVIGLNSITITGINCQYSILTNNEMKNTSKSLLTTDIVNDYYTLLESADTTIIFDNLVINEVMADNDITIPGPANDYPDWIELYNPLSDLLNIFGMYLTDDLDNPTKWRIPNGTTIEASGYLLIWCDGVTDEDGLYASFKLYANGDTVAIFAKDGTTLIDSVTFKKQIRDTSYGRIPDGGADWEYISDPSPGWTNDGVISDNELSSWVLPLLILVVILVIGAIIVIRRILMGREFR